jgi:hypothetical protein
MELMPEPDNTAEPNPYKTTNEYTNQSYIDLKTAIECFAAKHNASPDVFFEVWFDYINSLIEQSSSISQFMFLNTLPQCPFFSSLLESTTQDKCIYIFDEPLITQSPPEIKLFHNNPQATNSAIRSMLTLFVLSIRYPDYDYSKLTQEKNEFLDILSELLQDTAETSSYSATESAAPIRLVARKKQYLAANFSKCLMPIDVLFKFIQSEHAETAISRVKKNPVLWRAYDVSIPDINLADPDLEIGGLEFGILAIEACFEEMLKSLQRILDPHKLSLESCDILEYAFAMKYQIGDRNLPTKCSFDKCYDKKYHLIKRDFHMVTGLNYTATVNMVNNVNRILANSAAIIRDNPATIRVSYYFMQQHFIPEFAAFLKTIPHILELMQPSTTSITRHPITEHKNSLRF